MLKGVLGRTMGERRARGISREADGVVDEMLAGIQSMQDRPRVKGQDFRGMNEQNGGLGFLLGVIGGSGGLMEKASGFHKLRMGSIGANVKSRQQKLMR